jgi:hypothetical protein
MHAPGHGAVLATRETLDIMGERYGLEFAGSRRRRPTARRCRATTSR